MSAHIVGIAQPAGQVPQNVSSLIRRLRPNPRHVIGTPLLSRREFHDYFVTHLPQSSLHPDSRSGAGLAHKFPRQESSPHTTSGRAAPAANPAVSRDSTIVRIPLKSAKHHFGAAVSRGSRPYNEDSHQAGVIELPAFARKPPKSVTIKVKGSEEAEGAQTASGDPQVFYFGVFDGHGGAECSGFLRERLHEYIEKSSETFGLQSSLHGQTVTSSTNFGMDQGSSLDSKREAVRKSLETSTPRSFHTSATARSASGQLEEASLSPIEPPVVLGADLEKIKKLETTLVKNWKELVGGYFRRFKPAYFSIFSDHQVLDKEQASRNRAFPIGAGIEEVLSYSFLKADYDFVAAQASKQGEHQDSTRAERPLNDGDILGNPHKLAGQIGGPKFFKGGSTCSVAMVSTPSPVPFWNPSTPSSMLVAHVGDTRIILCSTKTGAAVPLTTIHHPSSPVESDRLRRYAATFVTDSFGEERISGLANTRAFGDIASKRVGVSAEPEIRRIELGAAEYSFLVLISDGVTGSLSDQEIVDIAKEAKTPEQAARDVVAFATEVSEDGDNATCLVVRMGGWERRQEGGHGSLGTKESRDFKRNEASGPSNRTR